MRRMTAGISALCAALLLGGCSAGGESRESADIKPVQAKALLDPTVGGITLPLMKYAPTDHEIRISERAIATAVNECLRPHQLSAPVPRSEVSSREDRMYGVWVPRLASRHGYSGAEDPRAAADDMDLSRLTSAQSKVWDECGARAVSTAPAARLPGIGPDSLSEKLRFEARGLARNSSEWTHATGEWKECLRGKGYSIGGGAEDWTPEFSQSDPPEKVVRLALEDVACKTKVNLVQRLGDLEASYQQALIVKNEAALKAQRDEIDRQIREAKSWLAARGL